MQTNLSEFLSSFVGAGLAELWPIFVGLIVLVWALATAAALMHWWRYAFKEQSALEEAGSKLRMAFVAPPVVESSAEPPGETSEPPHEVSVRQLVDPAYLLLSFDSTTIIADRIASIKKMRESHVKVNLHALQNMTLAKEAARRGLGLPGYAVGLSMMLGLLGTVAGLSVVVWKISAGLPTQATQGMTLESWAASINQIHGVLGGMKTAFAATMAGLSSAIVLSWLNHSLGRAQAALLNQVDRFTTEELLPATVPATEDESLLERVSLQLEASFVRLDEVMQNNGSTLKQLSTVEMGLVEIINSIKETTRPESPSRMHDLVSKLAGVTEQIVGLNKSLVAVAEALPQMSQEAQGMNTQHLKRIDQMIKSHEDRARSSGWSPSARFTLSMLVVALIVALVW